MVRCSPRKRSKRSPLSADASGAPALVPPIRRTRVTNGNRLFLEIRDAHSPAARRLRDLIALMVSDLGGVDACSESEKSLIRRSATLTLQLEFLEQRWASNGGEAPAKGLIEYGRATNTLRRTLEALGLKRRSKDITPTLDQYLRQKQQEADGASAED